MNKFTSKVLWFFLPFLLLPISYIALDPFKVLYSYENYSQLASERIPLNRDFISTECFLQNFKKHNYNSFIFGSSRSLAYRPSTWKDYLDEKAEPFSFDASGESIFGIYKKFKLLDSLNINIDNALLVLCRDLTFKTNSNHHGYLFIKHPILSKESSLAFQLKFFVVYLDPKFTVRYLIYISTEQYYNYMKGYIEDRVISIDSISNEINLINLEAELKINEEIYYEKRKDLFYKRNGEKTDTIIQIKEKERLMLNEIAQILKKNKTNYKIIINPLYEQITFNEMDMNQLRLLFGEKVFDFSGYNSFTKKTENYYETSHFRPQVGDSILKKVYSIE